MCERLNRRSSRDRKFPPSLRTAVAAPEPEPRSLRRFISALVATALVMAGALASTAALIVIVTIVPLGIDAARGVAVGPPAKQISWADGRTGVAVAHIRGDLSGHGHRQTAWLPARPRRRGAARREPDGRFGVVTLDDAYRAVDFDTITLLLGMMIVVANLRLSGFFRLVNNGSSRAPSHPVILLLAHCGRGRLVLGLSRQRRHLPDHDAAGARSRQPPEARSDALFPRHCRWPPMSAASRRSPAIRKT